MRIDILTLFPEMCETVMSESIIGRARRSEKVEIVCTNIRDFAGNKHLYKFSKVINNRIKDRN